MINDLKHDDHEGAMARAELYRAAKYAMKLFQMIDENQELEGWVQSKITKSADYLDSVYHYMEYQMKFAGGGEAEELDDITKDAETDIEDSIADADMSADEEEIKLDETLSYEEKLQALLEGRVKRKCSSKKMEEEAVSKSQQQAAGAALAAKRGDAPKSKLKGASKEMMKMSTKELEKFAGTKHKGLPDKKDKKVSEGSKPDFLDLDKDGNKKEPMKKAAKDAKKKTNEEKKTSVRAKNGKCPPGYNLSKDGKICIWADITNESIVREGDWYYDFDDPRSGSKGAVRKSNTPFWDELIKDVAEKHPEVNTASDFVKFYGVNEIEEVIAKLKKEGEGNNAPRSIKSAKLLRAARDKIAAQIDDSGQEVEEGILDTIGDTIGKKIKGYRDSAEAKHKEREAALKVLGNHIKDNSDDEAIVGRLYAVCLGDELECFYSYIVEKGLPITPEIKAIASKFKLKGTANMQMDENNLVKKVVKRVVAEKKAKPDFLDVDKDGNKKEPMKKALKDKEKETVKESAELTRMKQFLTRLNG